MSKRSKVWLATVITILGAPGVAAARDHAELVCSGVTTPKPNDGGDRIALFFHFFESRARGGVHRDEWLSTIYQGRMFQGHHLNKAGGPGSGGPIVLKQNTQIRFQGNYTVDYKGGTSPPTLHVVGKVNEDPAAKRATFRDIDETLTCVDLSI